MINLDAEDRFNKANDDLKRVTEHIEQQRTVNMEVQRRQMNGFSATPGEMQLPSSNRNSNGYSGK